MPGNVSIALTPTYQFGIDLSNAAGAAISIDSSPDEIAVGLLPILRGEKGDTGNAASRYVHTQAIAAEIWTVAHNLNARPNVTVCDHLDRVIEPDVEYIDANIVRVTHASAIAGFAYCI